MCSNSLIFAEMNWEGENPRMVQYQGFAIVISKLHVGYIEDQPIL